jgi:hypothetical protein
MIQREFLEQVNGVAPELMQKTAEALAEVDPAFLPEVRQDFQTICDVTLEKVAGGPSQGPGLGGFALAVGGTMAAGLATAIATDLYDAARRGLTKSRNFKRLMQANPDLKDYDQKRLKESFNTLHRYGPEFTADPLMGGSLLKALAGLPGNEHTLMKDVLKARKDYLDAKKEKFSPGHIQIIPKDKHGPGGGQQGAKTLEEKRK